MRPGRLAAVVVSAALVSCAEPARELARPAGAAGIRTAIESLAGRFGPLDREATFDAIRPKLAQAALVPSRAFDDPAVWSLRRGDWRAVDFAGAPSGAGYRLAVRTPAPAPTRPGEYSGRLQLRRNANGRFEWEMDETLAAGPVRPADLAAALTALFRAAERSDAAGARAAIAAQLPRASRELGRIARLERLAIHHDAAQATWIELGVRLTPDGLQPIAPLYAAFIRRYATPMKLHARAVDDSGATWWTLDAGDNLWLLRLRVRDGSLVPFEGDASRRIPTRLRVSGDYDTKMGVFGVGVHRLAAEVTLVRTPAEKGFAARFTQRPEWRLPFLVAPLIGGALEYPFEEAGSEAGWSARQQPNGTTVLLRHFRLRVRENWLVRWLGGLTTGAVDEFRRGAEAEADRYNRDCLLALRDDLTALASR